MPNRNTLNMALDNAKVTESHLKGEVAKLRSDLTSALADLARANESLALITNQQIDLRRDRESKSAEIQALNFSIQAQDRIIQKLQDDLTAAEELVYQGGGARLSDFEDVKERLRASEEVAKGLQAQLRESKLVAQELDGKLARALAREHAAEERARKAQDDARAVTISHNEKVKEFEKLRAAYAIRLAEKETQISQNVQDTARWAQERNELVAQLSEADAYIADVKVTMREAAELIEEQKRRLADGDSRVATAQADAERAERDRATAKAEAERLRDELARTRRIASSKMTLPDLATLLVGSAVGEDGMGRVVPFGQGLRAYLSKRVIVVEVMDEEQARLETAVQEAMKAGTNGHDRVQHDPRTKPCAWCDRVYENTDEHFPPQNAGGGSFVLAAWCTSCYALRERLMQMLKRVEPDWDAFRACLGEAYAVCPTLHLREPFIGHFANPSHQVGREPKERFLLETGRTVIPFPRTYSARTGGKSLAHSHPDEPPTAPIGGSSA